MQFRLLTATLSLKLIQLFEPMVHRALRPREGDAEGPRGSPAAERHNAAAAASPGILRHRLGYGTQVYLFRCVFRFS